jgi:hypothetical protein
MNPSSRIFRDENPLFDNLVWLVQSEAMTLRLVNAWRLSHLKKESALWR